MTSCFVSNRMVKVVFTCQIKQENLPGIPCYLNDYSCVFGKCNYRVRLSLCLCVFLYNNSKSNQSRNMKFEYENSI